MTSFGNTYLRVEGNTDATRLADGEHDAVGEARAGGEEVPREELPEHRRRRASRRSASGSSNPVAPNTTEAGRAAEPPHRHQGRPATRSRSSARIAADADAAPNLVRAARAAAARRTAARCSALVAPGAGARRAWCLAHATAAFAPPDFLPSPTEVARGTLQLFLQHDLLRRDPASRRGASRIAFAARVGGGAAARRADGRLRAGQPLLRADRGAAALHADLGVHPAADPLVRHLRGAEDRVSVPRRVRLPAAGGGDGDPRGARGAGADRAARSAPSSAGDPHGADAGGAAARSSTASG